MLSFSFTLSIYPNSKTIRGQRIELTLATVHELFLVLVKGVLSLASTAVALTLFYGLKSTLPFGPFLSWSCCSCNGAKAAGTRASALKKERSTFEASSPFMHGPRGTTALTAIEGPGQLHNHHTEEPDLQTTTIRHLTHFDAFREK